MGDDGAALEHAGADPHVGEPVAVGGVHAGLDLEDEGAEGLVQRPLLALLVRPRGRGGREREQRVEQLVDAEVEHRRAEQHRRRDAAEERRLLVHLAHGAEQLALLDRRLPVLGLLLRRDVGRQPLLRGDGRPAGGAGEADEVAALAVEHALEVTGDAHRPGQRGGLEAGAVADLVHELERLEAGAVPLVDDGDDRDAAVLADVEQLHRLRLEALGGVEQHHRAVDGGQDAVGVLGEVGVAGGVEQVDDGVAVGELQRGGADGDAARLLHVHPVRHGALAAGLAVDRTGLLDHPRVQRQGLGEGGLAGVRVADDGERAAPGSLPRGGSRRGSGRSSGGGGHDPPGYPRPPAGPGPSGALTTGGGGAGTAGRAPAGDRDQRLRVSTSPSGLPGAAAAVHAPGEETEASLPSALSPAWTPSCGLAP
jgi:hypothetical protein